jgi:single-strand DNA-binding protein
MFSNSGINKIMLLGHVTDEAVEDDRIRDRNCLYFRLVTTELIKKGNESITHMEYHKIKVPSKVMPQESINFLPGQMVYIEGKIQTTSYIDSQRVKRYDVEIVAIKVELHDLVLNAI